MKNNIRWLFCAIILVTAQMAGIAFAEEAKITVMNPRGIQPLIQRIPMAARSSLDGKTVYIVDTKYPNTKAFVNKLQEKNQIEADMKTRTQNLLKEQETREKELQAVKAELELINATNAGFKKKQEELEKKYYDLQSWLAWQKAMLTRDSRLLTQQLYNKILAAAEKVAKDGGYDMVIFKEGAADFSTIDPKEMNNAIRSRKVLYAAPDLDVTVEIVTSMNNDYKNSAK